MTEKKDDFWSRLRSRGLKFTRHRQLVWQEIKRNPQAHKNAADIYLSLKKKGYKVSLATVYRTLNTLVRTGLVRAEGLGEKHSHFEPEEHGGMHGHLICLGCGRVQEFEEAKLRREIEAIGRRSGFRLEKFSLQLFGFCEHCRLSR